MPEVLRENGYIIKIWFNDHPPKHVHVFKSNGECVIELKDQNNFPMLVKFQGMNRKEVTKALKLVNNYQKTLIEKWQAIHGDES
jgi:hypothetical protein